MIDIIVISIWCFMFGACTGSFLGLCSYRLPMGRYEPVREGIPTTDTPLSINRPARSFCPVCKHQLHFLHIIPILSWLALRGRCAYCKTRVPARYTVIELISGVFAVLSYLRFGLTPTALTIFIVVSALILITFIDLDYMIIPNVINYPGTVLGLLIGLLSSFAPLDGIIPLERPFVQSWLESVLGIIFGAGPLYLVWWLYLVIRKREGLGLGDIKLLIAIGALFGYECALLTIFLGSVLGSVVGVLLILMKRMGFSTAIPFGPYLVAGALVYLYDFADVITFLSGTNTSTIWRAFQ